MSGRGCCRALRCAEAIPLHMVMCKPHWFKVPVKIQHEIWHFYKTERGSANHLAAIKKAVDAIAKLEAA